MGIFAIQIDMGLMACLLAFLRDRQAFRRFPYLTTYIALRLLQRLIIFPVLWSKGINSASEVYWATGPILTAALFCVLCEFRRSKLIVSIGIALGLSQGVSYYLAGLYEWKWEPTLDIQGTAAVIVAGVSLIVLKRNMENLLALGSLAFASTLAISDNFNFMLRSQALRWLPDFGYIFGLLIWIVWARRLEPITECSD